MREINLPLWKRFKKKERGVVSYVVAKEENCGGIEPIRDGIEPIRDSAISTRVCNIDTRKKNRAAGVQKFASRLKVFNCDLKMAQRPTSIHVNPKFVGVHFNPNFLQQRPPQKTKILINPNFIPPLPVEPPPPELRADAIKPPPPPPEPAPSSAIIRNTRRSLVRASALSRLNVQATQSNQKSNQTALSRPPQQQLIKLGNNKVVNANYLMDRQQKENEQIKNATISIIQSKKLRRRIADRGAAESVYKLDRRDVPVNKKKIVRKFSIKRVDATSPKKVAGAKA